MTLSAWLAVVPATPARSSEPAAASSLERPNWPPTAAAMTLGGQPAEQAQPADTPSAEPQAPAAVAELAPEPVQPAPEPAPQATPEPAPAKLAAPTVRIRTRTIRMKVTAYCPCPLCCGKHSDGKTASGRRVSTNGGRFVAADTSVLPMYTWISIPGYAGGQSVQVLDRGGKIRGNRLDVFFPTHSQAKAWGVKELDVTVYEAVTE